MKAPTEELLRGAVDFLAQPVFIKDDEHRIVHANPAFLDMFGMDIEDTLGSTLAEAVPEDERAHFLRVDRSVLDTGVPDLQEETLTLDGVTRHIVTSKRRYVTREGDRFLIGSIHDVTDYTRIQQRLEEEKSRLRAALLEIRTLTGLLPICSYCKNIREDSGAWSRFEHYIAEHSDATISHGICDDCLAEHFPGVQRPSPPPDEG